MVVSRADLRRCQCAALCGLDYLAYGIFRPVANPPVSTGEVRVPFLGALTRLTVIDVLVAPGDAVAAGDPVVALEAGTASLPIPCPAAGIVSAVAVTAGDLVSAKDPILTLTNLSPEDAERLTAEAAVPLGRGATAATAQCGEARGPLRRARRRGRRRAAQRTHGDTPQNAERGPADCDRGHAGEMTTNVPSWPTT